ncbi:hypothetical protein [Granulicella sp. dw_53]|uniref:hypothetical protein n=1 Tax=Granulicella sp. dw_53 TaxID=2719792 RepID=UPI001BD4C3C0|nr:hypothetical protein [Granulicella sp. dw_53]
MTKAIPLGEDVIELMLLFVGPVVYGVMANLCYTLGLTLSLYVVGLTWVSLCIATAFYWDIDTHQANFGLLQPKNPRDMSGSGSR